jgi:hypothetical protein
MIEGYAGSLASEKADLTQAEQRTIEVAQISRGCSMLILAECASAGLICQTTEGWNLSPGARELGKFLTVELKALAMLGLDRRVSSESDPPNPVVLYLPEKHQTSSANKGISVADRSMLQE